MITCMRRIEMRLSEQQTSVRCMSRRSENQRLVLASRTRFPPMLRRVKLCPRFQHQDRS